MTTISVTVRYLDVDVDLADIDTADLRKELDSRKEESRAIPPLSGDETHPLHEIFYALKFDLTDRATELTRAYVCDELGVIL